MYPRPVPVPTRRKNAVHMVDTHFGGNACDGGQLRPRYRSVSLIKVYCGMIVSKKKVRTVQNLCVHGIVHGIRRYRDNPRENRQWRQFLVDMIRSINTF